MAPYRYVLTLMLAQVLVSSCQANVLPTATTATASHFAGAGLLLEYPGSWNAATYHVDSSFSSVIVFLSTESMFDPCRRSANAVECSEIPVAGLSENGILVNWSGRSFPGWSFDPNKGVLIEVGGLPGTFESAAVSEGCRAIGGEMELVATIPRPEAVWNWTDMRACLRGPALAELREQVQGMLDGVVWTP